MVARWGDGARWERDTGFHPHEARYLKLDISKAREQLRWSPRWPLELTLARIVDWHKAWIAGADMREQCLREIADFQAASARPDVQASRQPAFQKV
jgi:CDP-glucose 4,6-dehydratase